VKKSNLEIKISTPNAHLFQQKWNPKIPKKSCQDPPANRSLLVKKELLFSREEALDIYQEK